MTDETNVEQSAESSAPEVVADVSLDEIFSGKDPEPEVVAEPEKVEAKEPDPEPEKEPEVQAEPKEEPKNDSVPVSVLLEERQRRQELEAKLKEASEKPAEQKPEFWDDPEKHVESVREELRAEMQQERQELQKQFLGMSLRQAESRHDDFGKAAEAFENAVKDNPALYAQAQAAPDFGEAVYKMGSDFMQLAEVGDISSLREKIREEERAKILAESKAEAEEREKKLSAIPDSLSSVQTASQKSTPASGDIPLDDIFEGR